jgi:hypothetical protein
MRWHILQTLIHKEFLRHLANRGGIALGVLLLGMALLMLAYSRSAAVQASAGSIRGVQHFFVDYWEDGPWVEFLKARVSPSLADQIHFRHVPTNVTHANDGILTYPVGAAAIQLRPPEQPGAPPKIWCWYPGENRAIMAPFENWFWRTTRLYFRSRIQDELDRLEPEQRARLALPPLDPDDSWVWRESHQQFVEQVAALKAKLPPERASKIDVPIFVIERSALSSKPIGTRTTLASALVLFALFFICVYLLPSLTCEERERGVLLAQALSPASPLEILAAKLLFYPTVAVLFAGLLGCLTTPSMLMLPMFWLTLAVLAFGSLGIGMTIAVISKTQRAASMTALCYMLVISMIMLICQQKNISFLPQIFLEYHGPRLLNALMTESVEPSHWRELAAAGGLALGWNVLATVVFRRFGWQ